ncbi:MAG: ABC transporter ATP-binding protein [Candidatus Methanoplasma sp.]|jgi:iron complex transport system ATP-binding protein|nr:ABC transporter ATP-binding protein [Candidatus Methanoplasma sp.]
MLFKACGIKFSYSSTPTLEDVTFDVDKGQVLTLLGPNGVGKTTLLKCLNKVLEPKGGSVMIGGVDMHGISRREAAKQMGYVPQRGEVSRMTVFDAVLLGRRPYIEWDASEKDLKLTDRIIGLMGLSDLSLRYVDEISGGEYQLVQIARALAQQPEVILMDEPTSSLDVSNQHMIMRTIRKIVQRNDMAAIMTIHDLNLAVRYSDRFVMMHGGRIFAAGGHEIITSENIRSAYHVDAYVENVKGIPIVIPK